jgi:hypothetical protein
MRSFPRLCSLPLMVLAAAPVAATTIQIQFDQVLAEDPADSFEEDCLSAVEADDCDFRAAAMESELTESLIALGFYSDAETQQLFESMLTVDSPRIQAIALHYLADQYEPPATPLEQIRTFFFGPDSARAWPAARLLEASTDDTDGELAARYREGRGEVDLLTGLMADGFATADLWPQQSFNEMLWDETPGFTEEDRYPNALRLLMDDRIMPDYFLDSDTPVTFPISAFVTDDSVANVSAHFTTVFGAEPFPSLEENQAEQEAISAELSSLQGGLIAGDQAAVDRYEALADRLGPLGNALGIATRLGINDAQADAVYWSDIPIDLAYEGPVMRSVSVVSDALLGRTVIRMYAPSLGVSRPSPPEEPSDSGGCGCHSSASGAEGVVAMAALAIARRRRQPK